MNIDPPAHGLSTELLKTSAEAASQRDEKAFGCRLCMVQFFFGTTDGGATAGSEEGKSKRTQYKPKWMSFNGLRSHLKEK